MVIDLREINNFFIHNPIVTASIGLSALIATAIYFLGLSGVVRKEFKRRGMQHKINSLKDHYILCGFGRVGQQVAHELAAEKQSFVILERDEAQLKLAKEHNWPYLIGDVALDESLFQQAQLPHAKAVIISVGGDADAIFMAVSARALQSDIFIVARASSLEAADKLYKIGVNRVALPYQIGGYHMATMALRPTVVDFLDTLIDEDKEELEMEEYFIHDDSSFEDKTIADLGPVEKIAFVALRHKNGKTIINPGDNQKLAGGDRLVAIGPKTGLETLTRSLDKQQKGVMDKEEANAAKVTDIKPSPFLKQEE